MINVTKTNLPDINKYNEYLKKIWEANWVTNNGQFVQELENKLSKYFGVKNILVVTNGTLALQLIFKALNLKGEVITTPFTFAATTNALLWEGLTPVFADIDPETLNINPTEVEKLITPRTSAILAVHVYGNACDMERLQKIAKEHNIKLIYDAAHAFGSEYKNKSLVSYGDASALSFHATKVFNTIEGGAIVVNDVETFEKIKLMRSFGLKNEETVVYPGINAKMNEFCAAMGLCNFDQVDSMIEKRKMINDYYVKLFNGVKINFASNVNSRSNYSYFPVFFENKYVRDDIYGELLKNGIKARKYFYPLTSDSVFFEIQKNEPMDFLSMAHKISDSVLCLPIYPDLDLLVVEKIVNIIKLKI